MAGTSTVDIAGTVEVTKSRASTPRTLMQTISDLEAKDLEITVPRSSTVALPLGLSSGVPEALFLLIYSPKKLVVRYTSADVSLPGPIELGIKGYHILTLTPGEGITAVSLVNANDSEDIIVEYCVAAKSQTTDASPTFYTDD